MNKKFKFVLNRAGVRDLMQSDSMQDILNKKADQVAKNAGDGFEALVRVGKTRASVKIHPETPKAYYSNLKHNSLLKALNSARE